MKLAICCIIKNELRYLREWIEYHLKLFDFIHLFEDYKSESHKDITKDYDNVLLLTLKEYNVPNYASPRTLLELYRKFLRDEKDKYDWVAFIDIDEFVTLEKGYSLREILKDYNDLTGLLLSWKMYNANGHIKKPEGNVLDNYTLEVKDENLNALVQCSKIWGKKSIVNMKKAENFLNVHYIKGAVDVEYNTDPNSPKVFSKIWLNHYFTKSYEDFCERIFVRGNMNNSLRNLDLFFILNPDLKPLQKLLVEKFRYVYCPHLTYVSKEYRIICGGNKRAIEKLKRNNYE